MKNTFPLSEIRRFQPVNKVQIFQMAKNGPKREFQFFLAIPICKDP